MADIIPSVIVKPSVTPDPGDTLVGETCNGLVKVYASKDRVKLMHADPRDPGNPKRRNALSFDRRQAKEVGILLREASLRIVS